MHNICTVSILIIETCEYQPYCVKKKSIVSDLLIAKQILKINCQIDNAMRSSTYYKDTLTALTFQECIVF